MVDPEENTGEENGEVDGEKPEDKAGESDDPAVKALKILEGIQADIRKPAKAAEPTPVATTYAEARAKIKAETGWTDAQVDFHLRSLGEVQGPLQQSIVMMEMSKRHPDFDSYRDGIEKELTAYPAASRGDKVLIEKIYFMERGKKVGTTKKDEGGTRIVERFPGFESGTDRSDTKRGGALTGQEKELAKRMGISEEKWAKARTTKSVRDLREV